MSNAVLIASLTIGIIFYLFFYWRRLREDYSSETLFTGSLFILVLTSVFSFLASIFALSQLGQTNIFDPNGAWFWGGFIGFVIAVFILKLKMDIKIYETFEAAGVGLLGVLTGTLFPRPESLLPLVLVVVFAILDSRYKRFAWYKSGRVGFAGFTTFGLFFLTRSMFAVVNIDMISFVGKLDSVLSAAVAFLMFFMVYSLSERN